jgi:hypothetical protein
VQIEPFGKGDDAGIDYLQAQRGIAGEQLGHPLVIMQRRPGADGYRGGPPPAQEPAGRRPDDRLGTCAGGERCRHGGYGWPGRGGTRGGAGGGDAGGSLNEASISASNSSCNHCGSAQIRSAKAVSAARVARLMPITLPGTFG